MNNNPIELLEEDNVTIKIKDYQILIAHNDTGFTIDIYQDTPLKDDVVLVREEQYWFDDLDAFSDDKTLEE